MASGNDIINITMATSKKKTSSSKSSGVITDSVTGKSFKKDSSGTYKPYTASSSSSSNSKNTSSSSSKNTSSSSSNKNTSSSSSNKSTPKVSYEQASKNLASGGLSGATLAAAQASLKNSYANTPASPAGNLPAPVIKDPVTGNQYSKDASGTYVPYTGSTPTPTETPSDVTGQLDALAGASNTPPSLVNTAESYLKSYLESLKPSKSEDNYQKQLDNLMAQQANVNASRDMGIQQVEEQPIATPFIAGQGAAITNRAAVLQGALSAQAVPLQQSLAREQARRQSAMDVSKTMIDYASSKDKITNDYNQTNYANANKASNLDTSTIEVNGRKVLINNQTGETIKDLGVADKPSSSSSSSSTKKDKSDDIASAVINFRSLVNEKGWRGIDPTMYTDIVTIIKSKYGSSAVLELEKALADAGLEVDYSQSGY